MSNIKQFTINGLFKIQDVCIPFDEKVKILMGENGLGKTTILNSLYYLLTKKWHKLVRIPFDTIELEFDNNSVIFFSKQQLEAHLLDEQRQKKRGVKNMMNRLQLLIGSVDVLKATLFKENSISHQDVLNYVINNKLSQKLAAPTSLVAEYLIRLLTDDFVIIFDDVNKIIDTELDTNILYFPTYRRVEEELQNLGRLRNIPTKDLYYDDSYLDEEQIELSNIEDETLIQFGMQDVDERIKKVIAQINDTSLSGFTTVTGEILTQMLKGFPHVTEETLENLNKEDIKIILNRVKANLSEVDRKNIVGIVESKQLSDKKDLVFFLSKLIEIYHKQRELDNSIKNFVAVCNKYLVDKKIVYDESLVTIDIERTNKLPVKLNQLSSGEKQIVSLFSKIYLEDFESYTILFDEPELSLSIAWQKLLLPDIVNSKRCKLLLAVTHSPFIFKNELDKYAVGVNVYINHHE